MQNVCVGEKHARFFQYNNSDLLHEVNKVIGIFISWAKLSTYS